MKKLLIVLAVLLIATVSPAISQEANTTIRLEQPLGPEADIQTSVLYVSPTGDPTEFAEAQRIEPIQPLDPGQENPLIFEYKFYVGPNDEVDRYFKTSFIDTSGNESGFSDPVKVRIDKVPPAIPQGLTVSEVEVAP